MSVFLICLTCSFLFIALYIIRDEVRRARDKRSGANVKRLHRIEGWAGVLVFMIFVNMAVLLVTVVPNPEPIVVVFTVALLLTGIIMVYRYEITYLSINTDSTITYRSWMGKYITTPITALDAYTYTPAETKPNGDYSPDRLKLWDAAGKRVASFSPKLQQEYTLGAHLMFRQTEHRWANMNNPSDTQTIDNTARRPLNVTQYLLRYREGHQLAEKSPTIS